MARYEGSDRCRHRYIPRWRCRAWRPDPEKDDFSLDSNYRVWYFPHRKVRWRLPFRNPTQMEISNELIRRISIHVRAIE